MFNTNSYIHTKYIDEFGNLLLNDKNTKLYICECDTETRCSYCGSCYDCCKCVIINGSRYCTVIQKKMEKGE